MRKKAMAEQDQRCPDDLEDYYVVEKIIDMKQQDGKTYYLVKWLNWDIKTCTWEEEKNVAHLKSLIKDYHLSRKYDQQHNLATKKIDYIEIGTSPYEATKYYGHVLYGDEPLRVVSVQVIEKKQKKEVYLEIEWQPRENGFKPTNSLIQSKILLQHCPSFVVGFYESKVRLIPSSQGSD